MKKLLVFILLFAMLFSLNMGGKTTLSELLLNYSNEFYIISNSQIAGSSDVVKNGDGYIIKFNKTTVNSGIKSASVVMGESVVIYNQNLKQILSALNLNIVSTSNVGNATEIVGYTNKLSSNSIKLNGKKVNVQIACVNNKIVVGHPLILQGF